MFSIQYIYSTRHLSKDDRWLRLLGLAGSVSFCQMENNALSTYDVPQGKIRLAQKIGTCCTPDVIWALEESLLPVEMKFKKTIMKQCQKCWACAGCVRVPLSTVLRAALAIHTTQTDSAFAYCAEHNIWFMYLFFVAYICLITSVKFPW